MTIDTRNSFYAMSHNDRKKLFYHKEMKGKMTFKAKTFFMYDATSFARLDLMFSAILLCISSQALSKRMWRVIFWFLQRFDQALAGTFRDIHSR